MRMNGHVIPHTPIVVDIWTRSTTKHVHFLTHCHADHMGGLSSSWKQPIYTSKFNVWFLTYKFKINPIFLFPLNIGDSHIVKEPTSGEEFTVTLIDANYCPGSVMFLFQGLFGTILYTGDFRYDPIMLENEILANVMKNELLDVLYIDNTYASSKYVFPKREVAQQEVLQLVRDHPKHGIVIGLRTIGKEELLRAIALEVKEKIYVNKTRLTLLQQLHYEDMFTTDPTCSRIHVVDFHTVTVPYMRSRELVGPHIAILPTAQNNLPHTTCTDGIYIVPYSDHSPYDELRELISKLKPTKLCPIVDTQMLNTRSESYWQLLNSLSIIPESLYQLCKAGEWPVHRSVCSANPDSSGLESTSTMRPCESYGTPNARPGILRKKCTPRPLVKKGVHFDLSETSSDDRKSKCEESEKKNTLSNEECVKKNTSNEESEKENTLSNEDREEVMVCLPDGNSTRVKVPANVRDQLSDVRVSVSNIFDFQVDIVEMQITEAKDKLQERMISFPDGNSSRPVSVFGAWSRLPKYGPQERNDADSGNRDCVIKPKTEDISVGLSSYSLTQSDVGNYNGEECATLIKSTDIKQENSCDSDSDSTVISPNTNKKTKVFYGFKQECDDETHRRSDLITTSKCRNHNSVRNCNEIKMPDRYYQRKRRSNVLNTRVTDSNESLKVKKLKANNTCLDQGSMSDSTDCFTSNNTITTTAASSPSFRNRNTMKNNKFRRRSRHISNKSQNQKLTARDKKPVPYYFPDSKNVVYIYLALKEKARRYRA